MKLIVLFRSFLLDRNFNRGKCKLQNSTSYECQSVKPSILSSMFDVGIYVCRRECM